MNVRIAYVNRACARNQVFRIYVACSVLCQPLKFTRGAAETARDITVILLMGPSSST